MNISNFDYNLPEKSIANTPPSSRGETNLLVITMDNYSEGKQLSEYCKVSKYNELESFIEPQSLMILNDTKVVPARVKCINTKGRFREIFILEKHSKVESVLKVIVKGRVKLGEILKASQDPKIQFKIIEKTFKYILISTNSIDIYEDLNIIGDTPIPPYLYRDATEVDRVRYQTEFAKIAGSVAAPTASLNFTRKLSKKLTDKGIDLDYITLHCGYGTFNPILSEKIEDHDMHSEFFSVSQNTNSKIYNALCNKKKIIAIGTTVTRTLEYLRLENLINKSEVNGECNIFITPRFNFQVIDSLLTNFHAPNSTPILLASAFFHYKLKKNNPNQKVEESIKLFLEIYNYALFQDFKFLSYGDSMLIL
jgi:S-adenosylmethionine:tRNA ribosyltransferase-isomerase